MRKDRPVKVAIVGGAGGVGASLAFNLLRDQRGHEVLLVDTRRQMTASHVLDLEQVLELLPGSQLRGAGAAELASADVVVVCAAVPLTLNSTRLAYLEGNA